MTEREICERIIKDGDCGVIDCYSGTEYGGLNENGTNCPCDCGGDCDNAVREARKWIRNHQMDKKKQGVHFPLANTQNRCIL